MLSSLAAPGVNIVVYYGEIWRGGYQIRQPVEARRLRLINLAYQFSR